MLKSELLELSAQLKVAQGLDKTYLKSVLLQFLESLPKLKKVPGEQLRVLLALLDFSPSELAVIKH